jgi:nucleoside-triphosphatase THEP1
MNKVIILTGEIQTGKTTLLQQFCLQRNDVAGILTPVVNGRRMFYSISEKQFFEMEAQVDEEQLAIGRYLFSAAAFTKACNHLYTDSKRPGIKYLIIDEIGPLETRKQQGLYRSLKEITATSFNYTLIIVVRQSLVEEAVKFFGLSDAEVLTAEEMKKHIEL